jgi:hypothetical protein
VIAAAALLSVAGARAAQAQTVTPSPLPGEDHQPLGLRAGGFVMFPSVETGVAATDNVFQATQGERGDSGYFVAPSMRIESEWVRHSFTLDASSRHLYYFNNPSEDELEFDISADTVIDVRGDTKVELEGSYALEQEGRGDVDVPGAAAEPPNEHTIDGSATVTHEFNRLEISVEGAAEVNIFEDVDLIGGGQQNNSDRDFTEYEGTLRLGYEISPRLQPFVSAAYSLRRHKQEIDDNGLRRDSDGVELEAGVEIEVSSVLSGELAVGYVHRDFEDGALLDIDGVTFQGTLLWTPSAITTVTFTASTDVEETSSGTLSGSIERRFGVSVTHQLRRNLMLGGNVDYTFEDFTGGSLEEETVFLALGLTYQLNRAVAFRLGYSYEDFKSNAGRAYTENRFLAGLLVQR